MLKGSTKRLLAFFIDGSGNPRESLDIGSIKFKVYYSDRSGGENPEEYNCDANNEGGFYSFEFSDIRNKDFAYISNYSGIEGDFDSDSHYIELEDNPLECVNVGDYKLYGLAQINGEDSSDVRIRVFSSDQNWELVRETSSGTTLHPFPGDNSKEYNWKVNLENPGTYIVELWKAGYISGTWTIVIEDEDSYFENLILE